MGRHVHIRYDIGSCRMTVSAELCTGYVDIWSDVVGYAPPPLPHLLLIRATRCSRLDTQGQSSDDAPRSLQETGRSCLLGTRGLFNPSPVVARQLRASHSPCPAMWL